jgi:hypothetical protein
MPAPADATPEDLRVPHIARNRQTFTKAQPEAEAEEPDVSSRKSEALPRAVEPKLTRLFSACF